jgi:hypothetical protein
MKISIFAATAWRICQQSIVAIWQYVQRIVPSAQWLMAAMTWRRHQPGGLNV